MANNKLTVSLLQLYAARDAAENIKRAVSLASELSGDTDLFLLPEMWIGFTAHDSAREALAAMRGTCASMRVHSVAGSLPWQTDVGLFNRSWLINDAGEASAFYDKVHLFSRSGENERFVHGTTPLIFDINGVTCSIATCYDIRFPEFTRSMALAGADVIFVPAQWPTARAESWNLLVRATAALCQSYVVACNVAAGSFDEDGTKKTFFGGSMIVSPWGEVVSSIGEDEGVLTAALDITEVFHCRKALPITKDRHPKLYRLLVE